jgi:ribosomal protein L16 Arg81 hydroxylase
VLLVVNELEEHALVALGGARTFLLHGGLEDVGLQRHGVLDGDVAAAAGQRVDAGEQVLLRGGREIDQQPLGDPCRRLGGIKTAVPQGLWPVVSQIDGDLAPLGTRLGAVTGENLTLEVKDLRLVQLEDRRRRRPVQAVGTGIQPRRQDDHLPYAGVRRSAEIFVEVLGAGSLVVDEMPTPVGGLQLVVRQLAVQDVGGYTADGATENLGVRVHDQRVRLLCLQRSRCRYEQRGRTDTRCDVPGITFASHPTHITRQLGAPFPMARNGNGTLCHGRKPFGRPSAILGCRQGGRVRRPVTTTFAEDLRRVAIEPSLAWLLQPLAVQTFLDEIWAKTHYHVDRCRADHFDRLFGGTSAFDELLEISSREPSAARLVREKDKKGPERYQLGDGSLDLVHIREDFADGYTIVVDGVERYARTVGSLARAIEVDLNFPTQVNAYITPPGSRGLVPHYDQHDVFVLQVQGSKIWHLYDGVEVAPHDLQRPDTAVALDGLSLSTDLRLQAGDVLYLPHGRVHAAEATSDTSIHLTVGIHAPSVLMLAIAALYSRSFRDDRLSAQLPPRHLDDPDVQTRLPGMVRDALRAIEDPGAIAEGLDTLADVLVRRGNCPPVGRISNTAGIDGETLVEKYRPLYSRVKDVGDGVALKFATLSIAADACHQAAMQFISKSTEPFRISELPQLNAQQQIELVRSLIVSGFLIRLPG